MTKSALFATYESLWNVKIQSHFEKVTKIHISNNKLRTQIPDACESKNALEGTTFPQSKNILWSWSIVLSM